MSPLKNIFLCTIFYFILMLLLLGCECKDYCGSHVCNNTKKHNILCKFQSNNPAEHCINYEKTIKSANEKRDILDKINSRRNKVAAGEIRSLPSAENMLQLEWDEELESSAQRWANQCIKQSELDIKDICRDSDQTYTGQNIATLYGEAPGMAPTALVDLWYMELLNVNASIISRYKPSAETGLAHYDYFTQLAWAESHRVGCGGVKFTESVQESSSEKNRTVHRLVCNFAPGGNIMDKMVYADGLPCSRCPYGGTCDIKYKALCNSKTTSIEENTSKESSNTEFITPILTSSSQQNTPSMEKTETFTPDYEHTSEMRKQYATDKNSTDEENFNPFDYFSHIYKLTTQDLTTKTDQSNACKNALAVEEFVEMLKKKLSNEPIFKELLLTTKSSEQNGNSDEVLTDANVAAFFNHVYSKKETPTTTALSQNEHLNSTLLVDLVEAVIFRDGGKHIVTEESEQSTQIVSVVSPVKIQAELAEVKPNYDFTGHYFFPEDDTEETSSEGTEAYYDTTHFPISDLVMEIENMKRNKDTTDFVDEILESDAVSESSTTDYVIPSENTNLLGISHRNIKKFLKEI